MKKQITAGLLALGLMVASAGAASAHGWHHAGWHHGYGGGWGCCGGVLLPFGMGLFGGYMLHELGPIGPVAPVAPLVPVPQAGNPMAACSAQYKSFDPATGLFKSTDGTKKICPYLK